MAVFYPERTFRRHPAAAHSELMVAFVFHAVVSPNMPILSKFAAYSGRKMQRSVHAKTGWEL
jgi:hypothetical protein